jgi:hypothetical protein
MRIILFMSLLILYSCQFIPRSVSEPTKVGFHTEDINLFWQAYDKLVIGVDSVQIIQEHYLDKGSIGLADMLWLRIESAENLKKWISAKPNYFRSIRNNSLQVSNYSEQMREGLKKLKDLYPDATFKDVYFVIGAMNSGGTTSLRGLLIGTELFSYSNDVDTTELSSWHKSVIKPIDDIPYIVIHELIHINQKSDGSNLLSSAIHEGSASFVTYILMGKNPEYQIYDYGLEHEKELWQEFKTQMNGTDISNWLYNGQSSKSRPADLGYFMGFQICQAFYNSMADKNLAIKMILEINNFEEFLIKSNYEKKF